MILNDEILLIYILSGTMNLLIVVKIRRPEIIVHQNQKIQSEYINK